MRDWFLDPLAGWQLPERKGGNPNHVAKGPKGGQFAKKGLGIGVHEMPYGKTHIEADPAQSDDVTAHLANLDLLPTRAADALQEHGTEFYISNVAVPLSDSKGHLTGVQPRGWPEGSTWDLVGGVYDSNNNQVLAGIRTHSGSTATALHEAGHALDYALSSADSPVSQHTPMAVHHDRLYKKLSLYLQQGGPGGEIGRKELFAEGVADVVKQEATARVIYDDEFVDWVKGMLNDTVYDDG